MSTDQTYIQDKTDDDITCTACGARSRDGYAPPTGGCPSADRHDHDWTLTSEANQ